MTNGSRIANTMIDSTTSFVASATVYFINVAELRHQWVVMISLWWEGVELVDDRTHGFSCFTGDSGPGCQDIYTSYTRNPQPTIVTHGIAMVAPTRCYFRQSLCQCYPSV